MSAIRNPFIATLGATPPILVGRDESLMEFGYALDDGPGAHERISLVVGPRGIGKTVLHNAFEDAAAQKGWQILSETASTGFVDRLRTKVISLLASEHPKLKHLNLTLFSIGIGASWEPSSISSEHYTLRQALKDLFAAQRELDRHAKQPTSGILITLDEMHY